MANTSYPRYAQVWIIIHCAIVYDDALGLINL